MSTQELPKEKYDELATFIDSTSGSKDELIKVLHKAQNIFGYLPEEVQYFVAKKLEIPVSDVYGVVTFYSYFTMNPRGKYRISVCMGTACYVRGAEPVLEEFKKELNIEPNQTTPDGKFSLDTLRCVGACGLAPVVMIGEKVYGHVTAEMVKGILAEYNE